MPTIETGDALLKPIEIERILRSRLFTEGEDLARVIQRLAPGITHREVQLIEQTPIVVGFLQRVVSGQELAKAGFNGSAIAIVKLI